MRLAYRGLLLSLLAVLLTACVNIPLKEVKDECASIQSITQRFVCYRAGINNQISSQLGSEYRDYVADASESNDPRAREVFAGVTVNIKLLPNGSVDRVTFLEAGRNNYFDNMVERAIINAGPFFMPVDKSLQKMLSEFRFVIEIE